MKKEQLEKLIKEEVNGVINEEPFTVAALGIGFFAAYVAGILGYNIGKVLSPRERRKTVRQKKREEIFLANQKHVEAAKNIVEKIQSDPKIQSSVAELETLLKDKRISGDEKRKVRSNILKRINLIVKSKLSESEVKYLKTINAFLRGENVKAHSRFKIDKSEEE